MEKSVLVSIIVPVYNASKFLIECIDSILAQTFTEFELILVDDGSIDESPAICDYYAKYDTRIKVIHKQNGGVSSARNAGLDIASGEWITFIDSDDFINSDFIESLYNPIRVDTNIEFVHGGCCNWANGKITGVNQKYKDSTSTDPAILFNNLRGLTFSKLFKNSILSNWGGVNSPLRFDTMMAIAEDMAFTMDYILKVKYYAFVSECGYMYRIDNMQSLTKKTQRPIFYKVKAQYSHFYYSVKRYIDFHNLNDELAFKRKKQCALVCVSMVHSLYYGANGRKERLSHLNSLGKEQLQVLEILNPITIDFKILLNGQFKLFDTIEYLIRLPYRLRYSRFGSIIYKIKRILKR